jgi:chromosome segregation ATPase
MDSTPAAIAEHASGEPHELQEVSSFVDVVELQNQLDRSRTEAWHLKEELNRVRKEPRGLQDVNSAVDVVELQNQLDQSRTEAWHLKEELKRVRKSLTKVNHCC